MGVGLDYKGTSLTAIQVHFHYFPILSYSPIHSISNSLLKKKKKKVWIIYNAADTGLSTEDPTLPNICPVTSYSLIFSLILLNTEGKAIQQCNEHLA